MKTKFYTLAALCLTLVLASCGGGEKEKEAEGNEEAKCFYSLNEDSYELTWTAYKTTDKVAVGGTFDEVTFSVGAGETQQSAIEGIQFDINTATVNSNNEERDGKITEHFFGTINTPKITGKVISIDMAKNKALLAITMNGQTVEVTGDFEMVENDFSFNASINVDQWNAKTGIDALNEVCYELHKGNDGVSKLWSEVAISFTGSLNKDCDE